MPDGRKQELRCFCSRQPMLAVYGIGLDGRPYIHVRIYKQRRVYGEMVFKGGELSLVCRECIRWHRITIRDERPAMAETAKPVELEAGNTAT
jgi:hypothetical protein